MKNKTSSEESHAPPSLSTTLIGLALTEPSRFRAFTYLAPTDHWSGPPSTVLGASWLLIRRVRMLLARAHHGQWREDGADAMEPCSVEVTGQPDRADTGGL